MFFVLQFPGALETGRPLTVSVYDICTFNNKSKIDTSRNGCIEFQEFALGFATALGAGNKRNLI